MRKAQNKQLTGIIVIALMILNVLGIYYFFGYSPIFLGFQIIALIYVWVVRKNLPKAMLYFSLIFAGLVFLFSGYVKAVDPMGMVYKLDDYFAAFNMGWLTAISLFLAFLLFVLEFLIGFGMVFRSFLKWTILAFSLFMIFFTGLTLYLAINNPVTDCGCFGDALKLTNWQTFYKNLFILIPAIIIWSNRKELETRNKKFDFGKILVGVVLVSIVSMYSLIYLPIHDFRPWKVGNKLSEYMEATPEESTVYLIYENKSTGEVREFTSDNLPWQDTVFMNEFEFKDQRREIVKPFEEAPIHDFNPIDSDGNDYTDQLLFNEDYQFLLVMHDINKAKQFKTDILSSFVSKCAEDQISFVGLSGSIFSEIDTFINKTKASYPIYSVDGTALKTIIRSNPGLLLLKNGVVIDKWPASQFPEYSDVVEEHLHQ